MVDFSQKPGTEYPDLIWKTSPATRSSMLRAWYAIAFVTAAVAAQEPSAKTQDASATGPQAFVATAYATKGNTVKGIQTQPGTVAADPKILPLGSSIRVTEAGKYSGVYVVTDVGTAIVGRRIDIYVMEPEAAKAFGRKEVQVELLREGDNVKFQPETTTVISKSALAPAQQKDAAAIPSNKVPASKVAVKKGRAVKAEEKAQEAEDKKKE
jgi:3D (Asp-Asp-Asp) domain-containing protein